MKKIFPGIFERKRKIYTKNLVPGMSVYGERLTHYSGEEYREWNPKRSKLGAAVMKGLQETGLEKGSKILYLGSAEGTTSSHVSDIIGEEGVLFGVDLSARVMRKFVLLCELRKNMIPILESASKPETYKKYVGEMDVVFQDVSQKNQTEIFVANVDMFLKKNGIGMLSIKARSIDVARNPRKVFQDEMKKLEKHFRVIQMIILHPFEKDHALFLIKK